MDSSQQNTYVDPTKQHALIQALLGGGLGRGIDQAVNSGNYPMMNPQGYARSNSDLPNLQATPSQILARQIDMQNQIPIQQNQIPVLNSTGQ
jgi:hypothetical protein